MLRRLLIAFFLSALIAVLCWIVLPSIRVPIPWWVPLLAFALIAIPTLLTGIESKPEETDEMPQIGDMDFPPPEPNEPAADQRG